MRYNIKGKNMEIGDRTREKVSAKLDRVKKLFPEDAEAAVLIKSEKLEYVVEVTIPMSKRVVRAEVASDDMMAAVDKAVDIIERQTIRFRLQRNSLMKSLYIRLKRANTLRYVPCRRRKPLCRWSFLTTASSYSETIPQRQ